MRARKYSIACNSSWGALLWHFIAVANFFVALMILSTGVTVGVHGMVIIFPRVSCAHRSCLVGGIGDTIVFNEGANYQALTAW